MAIFSKIAVIAFGCMLMASVRLSADATNDALAHPPHPAFKVYVSGDVQCVGSPFEIEVPTHKEMTVSQAIIKAGGFVKPEGFEGGADQRRVKLLRKKSDGTIETIIVDVKAVLEGRPVNDPILQAEDQVIVPQRMIN